MTSIKIKFRPSAVKGKEGVLYFQITHQRVTRQIATTHRVYAHEWLAAQQCVVTYKGGYDRRQYLDNVTTMLNGEHRLLSHRGMKSVPCLIRPMSWRTSTEGCTFVTPL